MILSGSDKHIRLNDFPYQFGHANDMKKDGKGDRVRKYAYLRKPLKHSGYDSIVKVMLYKAEEGIYLFGYSGLDSNRCSFDKCYDSLEELYDEWNGLIDERGWIQLDDPLPYCQHDAFIPIRARGRDIGKPEWGKYETLRDGKWVEYE